MCKITALQQTEINSINGGRNFNYNSKGLGGAIVMGVGFAAGEIFLATKNSNLSDNIQTVVAAIGAISGMLAGYAMIKITKKLTSTSRFDILYNYNFELGIFIGSAATLSTYLLFKK